MKAWRNFQKRKIIFIVAGVALILFLYFAWRTFIKSPHTPQELNVYAFSTQKEVFTQGIFPAFEQEWEERSGRDLTIHGVFGPSGTIAGQIDLGAPADVAVFSNAYHITWLQIARVIRKDTQPVYFGSSPIVIVVRPENPKHVSGFSDLSQPGLVLLHEDPRTSGAGEWALLAEYANAYLPDHDQKQGQEQVTKIWKNVRLMAPSAQSTMTLFELGAGGAFLTYEQHALMARERGVALEIITPVGTVLTQPAAIMVDDNVKYNEQEMVRAFLSFLTSERGRNILTEYHWRPPLVEEQIPAGDYFTVADLGGWSTTYKNKVYPYWEETLLPAINLVEESTLLDLGE